MALFHKMPICKVCKIRICNVNLCDKCSRDIALKLNPELLKLMLSLTFEQREELIKQGGMTREQAFERMRDLLGYKSN